MSTKNREIKLGTHINTPDGEIRIGLVKYDPKEDKYFYSVFGSKSSIKNYKDAWSSIVFAIRDNTTGNGTQVTADQLTTNATKATITLDKFNTLYPMEEHS